MKKLQHKNIGFALLLSICLLSFTGCENFVEVDSPNSQLDSNSVFSSDATANAAVANLYAQQRETGFLSGNITGLSYLLGLYTDELELTSSGGSEEFSFYTNIIPASNNLISSVWSVAYNQIYASNLILQKMDNSSNITALRKDQFSGEALFFRALNHFYRTQLFGDMPFITATNYEDNTVADKIPSNEVMALVIADLESALVLLPEDYPTDGRARVNKYAAQALLARVYLYSGMWPEASNAASAVINNSATYSLESLDTTFLQSSTSTILQLASAYEGKNTEEAALFIFETLPPPSVYISSSLIESFEPNDARKDAWLGSLSDGGIAYYYAFKYKERFDTSMTLENSILFRLEEPYLIRAEARIRQGEISSGRDDLNTIRERAGLSNSTSTNQNELLDEIIEERRHELFTEQGHRFFDLKRTGKINEALGMKPGWSAADILWPIPQLELLVNPHLAPQNPGY